MKSSSEQKHGLRRYGGHLFRLTVTIFFLWVIFKQTDLSLVGDIFLNANLFFFFMAMIFVFADRALMIGKWYPLLALQAPSITFMRAARAYLASSFASLIMPSTVGADLLRAISLGRSNKLVMEIGASIAVERLFGMVASAIFILIALFFALSLGVNLYVVVPWAIFLLCASILITSAIFISNVRRAILHIIRRILGDRLHRLTERFVLAFNLYRHHKEKIIVFAILTLAEQLMPIMVNWMYCMALGIQIELYVLFIIVPVICFLARIPIAINGIGVAEGAFVFFAGFFEVSTEQAVALAFSGRIGDMIGFLPGAFFWADLTGSYGELNPAQSVESQMHNENIVRGDK